jgi:replicative DNA helicase
MATKESAAIPSLLSTIRVLTSDTGSEVSVAELAESGDQSSVWSLDARQRMTPARLVGFVASGVAESFTVRMASGREMEAAADAQLMSLVGWKPLGELAVGDRVAVPRRVPAPVTTRPMDESEVILLAHMIGDGSCVKRQPIRYASIDEENLRAVTNAAKHFGVTAIRDEYAAARVTTLRLPAPYRLTHGVRNPIAAWLDGLGLFGKRSYEKFVPDEIFAAPNEQIALFLRHLWATDGCVHWSAKGQQARIYYASTSRRLVDDVRQLLLRLKIGARLYRVPQGEYRDSWHLVISGRSSQMRFLLDVDVHGERAYDVREVLINLVGVNSNENVDTVPREIWDRVRDELKLQRMSHRAFAEAMGIKFCGSTLWKHSPSRARLHRTAAILDDRGLHDLSKNDVFWDKIVEITPIGEREVYSVRVEGADNVVVNGVTVRVT